MTLCHHFFIFVVVWNGNLRRQTWRKIKRIALDGPLRNVCLLCWSEIIGKLFTWFQTWLRCSLEHSLPNTCILCTSKIQDGRQTEWGKEWTIFLKLENWIRPKPYVNNHRRIPYKVFIFCVDQKSKFDINRLTIGLWIKKKKFSKSSNLFKP